MKNQSPLKMGKHGLLKADFLLILIPALLWLCATLSRPYVITAHCITTPQRCTQESVSPIDRLSLGMESLNADGYSFDTQNLSGALAAAGPVVWNLTLFGVGRLNLATSLAFLVRDWVIILQSVSWNGLFTEISHLISQRPRPFVYSNPSVRGIDPSHYVSFYSGHTSFSAAAMTALFLILLHAGAPLGVLLLSVFSLEALVFSTAYFRILAGRHFLSDVICGAIAGSLVAFIVAHLHQRRRRSPISS